MKYLYPYLLIFLTLGGAVCSQSFRQSDRIDINQNTPKVTFRETKPDRPVVQVPVTVTKIDTLVTVRSILDDVVFNYSVEGTSAEECFPTDTSPGVPDSVITAKRLQPSELAKLLSQLPVCSAKPDQPHFAFPEETLPPPRAGSTI